jgi:hypothetical protein
VLLGVGVEIHFTHSKPSPSHNSSCACTTSHVIQFDRRPFHWMCLVHSHRGYTLEQGLSYGMNCIWKENEKPNLYTIIVQKCYFTAPPTCRLPHLAVVITSIICTSRWWCVLLLLRRLLSLLRRRSLRIVGLVSRCRCRRSRRLGTAQTSVGLIRVLLRWMLWRV